MANILFLASFYIIWFILLYYIFLMQGGFLHVLRYRKIEEEWGFIQARVHPKVSVLIPAHNEPEPDAVYELVMALILDVQLQRLAPRSPITFPTQRQRAPSVVKNIGLSGLNEPLPLFLMSSFSG